MFFPPWHRETAASKRETVISRAWHLWRWPSVRLKRLSPGFTSLAYNIQTVEKPSLWVEPSRSEWGGGRFSEVTTETSCLARKWAWPNWAALTDTGARPREPEWREPSVIPATCHPCYAPSCVQNWPLPWPRCRDDPLTASVVTPHFHPVCLFGSDWIGLEGWPVLHRRPLAVWSTAALSVSLMGKSTAST